MKSKFALGVIVAATAVFAQTAFAQASAPVTREQRKAETAAANKSGKLAPAGEGPGAMAQPASGSDKTRTDRKAQTQSDIKSGKTAPAGDAAVQKADKADAAKPSQTTRDARKEKTKAQQKNKEIPAAGEGGSAGKTKQ